MSTSRLVLALLGCVTTVACGEGPAGGVVPSDEVDAAIAPIEAPMVAVEVRTSAREVLFHDRAGRLHARVPVVDGIARAQVPLDGSATVGGRVGRGVDDDGVERDLYRYETATGLAAGDVLTLAPVGVLVHPANLPDLRVTLPAPPPGTTRIEAYACGSRVAVAEGGVVALDRRGCGDQRGALFVAGDPAPRATLAVAELGAGPEVDLRAARWSSLVAVEVALAPAPDPAHRWTLASTARPDGHDRPLAAATGGAPLAMAPGVPGMVIATLRETPVPGQADELRIEQTLDGGPPTGPAALDAHAPALPDVRARAAGPRGFALSGATGPERVIATLDGAGALIRWTVRVPAGAGEVTLPEDGLAPGALRELELIHHAGAGDTSWTRTRRVRW